MHAGDTSQGKSWIANLLVMLSLVDRFTYKNANKGILKNDDLEAMADFIKERYGQCVPHDR